MKPAVARYREAAAANACGVHGPLGAADAAEDAARLAAGHAGRGAVAIAEEALVDALGLARLVAEAGCEVLRPHDPGWAGGLPGAAVGITAARMAVAATGSVVLTTGPGSPRATSLLPPVHVCVVRTDDVLEEVADAFARLAGAPLPSAVVWIGGPSRSADLEMRQTLGVHGPRVVEVVLVGS